MLKQNTIQSLDTVSRLEQISGVGQGQKFEIYKERMTIGRVDECDIVLPSESVSRTHAFIEKNGELGYLIFDNDSKNGVFVNGARVEAAPLHHGDSIQIGNFGFRYYGVQYEDGEGNKNSAAVVEKAPSNSLLAKLFNKKPSVPSTKQAPNKRLLIYGGVGLVLLVVYMNQSDEKKDEVKKEIAKDETKVEFSQKPEIVSGLKKQGRDSTLEDPIESTSKKLANPDLKDSTLLTSEQYFRMGLREHSNKNYQRAIDNFRNALILSSRHPLAQYYLDLSVHQTEEAAKRNREMAIQAYQTMQYDRAIFYCREVIAYLTHNPEHPSARSCKDFIENAKQLKESTGVSP